MLPDLGTAIGNRLGRTGGLVRALQPAYASWLRAAYGRRGLPWHLNGEPIRIDPATGHKLFNTRAAKASDRIEGKGYDVVTDAELITLPAFKADATFNEEAQARYRQFNEVRRGENLIQCESCLRILYFLPQDAATSAP